LDGLHALNLDI